MGTNHDKLRKNTLLKNYCLIFKVKVTEFLLMCRKMPIITHSICVIVYV